MLNPEKYKSVIWVKGGRNYPFLDCFGVVNEILRDLSLQEWPDFHGVTKDDGGLDREARGMMKKVRLCSPCPGAVAFCYSGSLVTHVGIVVEMNGQLCFAECNPRMNATFLPLPRARRRFIKMEFYQ